MDSAPAPKLQINVSEKLFERLQAESLRTGTSVDIVAEQAILRSLSTNKTEKVDNGKPRPVLYCERCQRWHRHTFNRPRKTWRGMEQLFDCSKCSFTRVWGLITIGAVVDGDDDAA